jgi:hypothetical protein
MRTTQRTIYNVFLNEMWYGYGTLRELATQLSDQGNDVIILPTSGCHALWIDFPANPSEYTGNSEVKRMLEQMLKHSL